MAFDPTSTRSRRAVLGAALGAGAAAVAAALGRPSSVRAADGDPVVQGAVNQPSSTTSLEMFEAGTALVVRGEGAEAGGLAINAYGATDGIYALGSIGTGITGVGIEGNGVVGIGNGAGVLGYYGYREDQIPFGTAAVHGLVGTGGYDFPGSTAVRGEAKKGVGVRGQATTGTGVLGTATSGWALRTLGKVKLEKSAGLATIATGTKSVTVTPGIDLTPTTAVHSTMQGSAGGTTTVHRVSVNSTTNQFTIYLTANSIYNVNVAWLILG
jgi:hypothetical protein